MNSALTQSVALSTPTRATLNRIVATWCTLRNWYAIPECLSSVRHEVPRHVRVQIYHRNRIRHARAAQARAPPDLYRQNYCRTCKYTRMHIHTRTYRHTPYRHARNHDTPLSCSLKKMPTTTASSWTRRFVQDNTVDLDARERWCKLIWRTKSMSLS